ncbi:SLATT domain-containing protein [Lentzea sp. NPDC058450]|uniref:SLATT domain-containing protein n=1 Tax=Lentzea sp. NPDC058450 TaxID=3346505 RepID=UPI00365D77DE
MRATTVDQVWGRQRRWSLAADAAKASLRKWRLAVLVFSLAGAVAGAMATYEPRLALVSMVATGLAGWAATHSGKSAIRESTGLRAVSEALKAEVHTYLAKASRYRSADRDDVLGQRAAELTTAAGDLASRVARTEDDGRSLPAVHNAESYVDNRLTYQVNTFYRPKAHEFSTVAARLRTAQIISAGLGTAFAAAVLVPGFAPLSVWIGVFTTAGTALTAHAAASRSEHVALVYERTADELESLRARWCGGQVGDEVVEEGERVLAKENEAWLAQWSSPVPETSP